MIVVDGSRLTVADIATATDPCTTLSVPDEARARVAAAASYGVQVADSRPLYGRTTGVGANRTVELADPGAQALGLLRSHATAAGPLRSRDRVRAMLTVRLNQLLAGGSGVSVEVVDGLVAMLGDDTLPPVREVGSVGTGDLPALAVTGLALAGLIETDPPLRHSVPIGINDSLAFISSNAAALADAALALSQLGNLARAALTVAALSHVAVGGNREAFEPAAERTTPFPGASTVCATMRTYIDADVPPARIQDPFGLRALPQVHGALLDRLFELTAVVTALVNAPTENPVLLPELGVAHHGGFHAAYLAQALDATRSALAQSGQLGLSRVTMFAEPALTGLPPFLADGTAGTSGTMSLEYVCASALASLRAEAAPTAVHTVALSRGAEEGASFASLAASSALGQVAPYRTVVACELLDAVRCLRMRDVRVPAALSEAFERCAVLPADVTDRDLTADLSCAEGLLDELA